MKAKILLLSALAAVGMMFTSCDDDDDNGSFADGAQAKITKFEAITVDAVPGQPATEETPEVPGTPASFTLRAEYKMAEGYVCGGAGFCYSTNPDPTIYDNGVKAENLVSPLSRPRSTNFSALPSRPIYVRMSPSTRAASYIPNRLYLTRRLPNPNSLKLQVRAVRLLLNNV